MPHSTDNAAYAARLITDGPFRRIFLARDYFSRWNYAAGTFGLEFHVEHYAQRCSQPCGVLVFEWCFVMAGQSVPNS